MSTSFFVGKYRNVQKLKFDGLHRMLTAIANFNSSMVRLKVATLAVRRFLERISIPVWYDWKEIRRHKIVSESSFQFQYGTIERQQNGVVRGVFNAFQFQYGTIERVCNLRFCMGMCRISIPVWYDWKSIVVPVGADTNSFQFQYGTIESVPLITVFSSLNSFQFQYGTIESVILP